ncbi:MAG: alpha/beta fold hydrolase [Bacteroidota bacterium]|nr:alpha/beta fold hydrolase [Bacteroidota bacterium]
MKLHYKEYGSGKSLIILHGFLGSLDNWHTLATRFGKSFNVFAIDQRNHGKTQHSPAHSIAFMVADLLEFVKEHKLSNISIIGHSMGGKVAMQFALEHPEIVENLIVVDIAPKHYERGHDAVFKALFAVKLNQLTSRKDAEDAMLPFLPDYGTRQFLLKNLERNADGSFQWKMNLPVLYENYEDMSREIFYNLPFLGRTLFIKGEKSAYILKSDDTMIKTLFPNSTLITIAGAGHWVHADKPDDFYETVLNFIVT